MEESKEPVLVDFGSSDEEVKPKKRGKKKIEDDDFEDSFQDEQDDFNLDDAENDYASLPSNLSDDDIPDAFADMPATPPKRIRKPKGEKKPSTKRSAPKSPPKAKKISSPISVPHHIDEDIICLSDSEDFNPRNNISSDNDDIVVGKSVKQRKTYYKSTSATKPTSTTEIPKSSEKSVSTPSSASKSVPSTSKSPSIKADNEKKRNRMIGEDEEAPEKIEILSAPLLDSLPSVTLPSNTNNSEMVVDKPIDGDIMAIEDVEAPKEVISEKASISPMVTDSEVLPPSTVVDNAKKRTRPDDSSKESPKEAISSESLEVLENAIPEGLPPSPKKAKLEETVSSAEIVVEVPKEVETPVSSSKPATKAKKAAKATAAPKKASSAAAKPKSTASTAKKAAVDSKKGELPVSGSSDLAIVSPPPQVQESSSANKMDVDAPEVAVDSTLKETKPTKTSTNAATKDPKMKHTSTNSTVAPSSASKPSTLPKPASSKVTSSISKSTTANTPSLGQTSPHKRASTSPLNAPFKPAGTSSGVKPSGGIPGQTRPAIRMGLSRASKPLHPPVK